MKTIKLTKKMLKMHPADLLIKLNLVNKEKTIVYPQHVYFSKEDYKELRGNLMAYAKKQVPFSTKRLLDCTVGVDLLNYGPNESLADAIKPGYAIIDEEAIKNEREK